MFLTEYCIFLIQHATNIQKNRLSGWVIKEKKDLPCIKATYLTIRCYMNCS